MEEEFSAKATINDGENGAGGCPFAKGAIHPAPVSSADGGKGGGCPFAKGAGQPPALEPEEDDCKKESEEAKEEVEDEKREEERRKARMRPVIVDTFEPHKWPTETAKDEKEFATASKADCGDLWRRLVSIVELGHKMYSEGHSCWNTLNLLTELLVDELNSGMGYAFIARYQTKTDEETGDSKQVLRILSYTNIAWTKELQELVRKVRELEFDVVGGGVFAEPFRTRETIVLNNPSKHPAYKGLPDGHPGMRNFIGVPMWVGEEMVGIVAVANYPGVLNQELKDILLPFAGMMGGLILLYDLRRQRGVDDFQIYNEAIDPETREKLESDCDLETHAVADHEEKSEGNKLFVGHSKFNLEKKMFLEKVFVHGAVLDAISDGIVVFDEDLLIHTVNRAAVKLLNFESGIHLRETFKYMNDLIASTNSESDFSEMGKLYRIKTIDDLAITLGMSLHMNNGVQVTAVLKRHDKADADTTLGKVHRNTTTNGIDVDDDFDVGTCEVEMTITRFEGADGKVLYTALFRDISIQAAFRKKDVLLAFLSHEIRNPLQMIISGTQIQNDLHKSTLTEDIYGAAQLLHSVVNDTVDFVRIAVQKFTPESVRFDLETSMMRCMRVYCPRVVSGVRVDKPDISGDLKGKMLIGDERRYIQIVGNLLSNSAKHTREGHLSVRCVRRECHEQSGDEYDGEIVTYVIDTGCGMTEEDKKNLFKIFTKASSFADASTPSSGLGLVLSRNIARALGGDVWLESSSAGKGTVFAASMPYKQAGERTSRANDKVYPFARVPSESNAGGNSTAIRDNAIQKLNVLIVDDNAVIVSVMQRLLRLKHVPCKSLSNGQEAYDTLTQGNESFDVVFMDCLMPVMDGFDAVRKLRSAGYTKPIIAVTGNSTKEDTELIVAAGYDAWLLKPVKNERLLDVLFEWGSKLKE